VTITKQARLVPGFSFKGIPKGTPMTTTTLTMSGRVTYTLRTVERSEGFATAAARDVGLRMI
jgi:hypothetical protein